MTDNKQPEIRFYHLVGTDMSDAIAKLLHVCMGRDWRAVVVSDNDAYLQSLDGYLWGYGDNTFLAHSRAGSIKGGECDNVHPILLSNGVTGTNSPYALFMTHTSDTDDFSGAELICRMFEGHDEVSVNHARVLWKRYADAGYHLTYWQQEGGSWVKKTEANTPE